MYIIWFKVQNTGEVSDGALLISESSTSMACLMVIIALYRSVRERSEETSGGTHSTLHATDYYYYIGNKSAQK